DIDFCEFNGRLIINYSWGNQGGTEFIAEAEYDGTSAQFLEGWFLDTGWTDTLKPSQPTHRNHPSMLHHHKLPEPRTLNP
ncbi:MAG: hypothetical protein GY809_01005, partial [Planctomycetes bacterium]|nr:hypothetical protein [Planctomycetota bacterium]